MRKRGEEEEGAGEGHGRDEAAWLLSPRRTFSRLFSATGERNGQNGDGDGHRSHSRPSPTPPPFVFTVDIKTSRQVEPPPKKNLNGSLILFASKRRLATQKGQTLFFFPSSSSFSSSKEREKKSALWGLIAPGLVLQLRFHVCCFQTVARRPEAQFTCHLSQPHKGPAFEHRATLLANKQRGRRRGYDGFARSVRRRLKQSGGAGGPGGPKLVSAARGKDNEAVIG